MFKDKILVSGEIAVGGAERHLQAMQIGYAVPVPVPDTRIAPREARLDSLCPIV